MGKGFIYIMTNPALKVQYNNLSAIADSIKGYSTPGPSFFTYNGKRVSEIAEETQWEYN